MLKSLIAAFLVKREISFAEVPHLATAFLVAFSSWATLYFASQLVMGTIFKSNAHFHKQSKED